VVGKPISTGEDATSEFCASLAAVWMVGCADHSSKTICDNRRCSAGTSIIADVVLIDLLLLHSDETAVSTNDGVVLLEPDQPPELTALA
jgi:hypothetical protein